MARHDALTNLPNRTLFREQLEKALRLVKRSDQLAVFCLDLDHFKEINDSLGHPVGDALLKEVARRLGECVTENDTVARLGGDEFAIVQFCSDCDPSAVASLASHIVEKIGGALRHRGPSARRRRQHRHLAGARGRQESRRVAEEGRSRALSRQGGRPRHLSLLRDRNGCPRAGAAHSGTGSARGAATRRVRGLLSADPRRRQRQRRRVRGPGALESFAARHDRAGRISFRWRKKPA